MRRLRLSLGSRCAATRVAAPLHTGDGTGCVRAKPGEGKWVDKTGCRDFEAYRRETLWPRFAGEVNFVRDGTVAASVWGPA